MVKPETTKSLFDSDDDEDNEKKEVVKINKKFATAFESRKQKEELRRVRYEEGEEDGSSSESSSEDEGAELLTTKLDVDIIKTINALRNKDSRIYDSNIRFFSHNAETNDVDSSDDDDGREARKGAKPKRYKDVVREQILERMNKGGDSDSEENDDPANLKTSRLAYDAAQHEFRKAFLESTKDSDDDDIIVVKTKKKNSVTDDGIKDDTDEDTHKQFHIEIEQLKASSKGDNYKLIDPKGEVEDGETFLLDYFKNRPWIDRMDSDEDDNGSDEEDRKPSAKRDDDTFDEDASLEELDEADDFEAQYNFRFEEAAAGTASGAELSNVSYARGQTMNTLRRKDESRSEKRQARQERKAAERKAKEEQLKRLKNAKRQEMQEKLKQVKTVLGEVEGRGGVVDEAAILKLLEGDFDPKKFEELIQETYNDEFYQREDQEWTNDQSVRQSLRHDEDGELLVGLDDVDGGLYDNDEDELGDSTSLDDDEGVEEEEWLDDLEDDKLTSREESKVERNVKAKMEEELYKLDYEDIVAGIPTRFKYRQVEPNNYGISTEEILFARDSTLKQFVSLKKLAPYTEDEYFVGSKKRRRFREMLKNDLNEAIGTAEQEANADNVEVAENPAEDKIKKRRRLKKGLKLSKDENDTKKLDANVVEHSHTDNDEVTEVSPKTKENFYSRPVELKSKRVRRRKKKSGSTAEATMPENDEKGRSDTNDAYDSGTKEGRESSSFKSSSLRHHKKKKRKKIEGVSDSRLASYGL